MYLFYKRNNALFACNSISGSRATRKIPQYPSKLFYSEDTIKTLYNILSINQSYGIGWRQFFTLLQQTGEEKVKQTKTMKIVFLFF